MKKKWNKITIKVKEKQEEKISVILSSFPNNGAEIQSLEDGSIYKIYCADSSLSPLLKALEAEGFNPSISSFPDKDWMELWKKNWKPFEVGNKFLIVPSWESCKNREGREILNIDPGMAFGTGKHETTFSCIELIEEFILPKQTVLDIGTGSGILSIVASKCRCKDITSFDTDSKTMSCAMKNFKDNECNTRLFCGTVDAISPEKKYSFVVVNIFWEIIKDMFPSVLAHLEKNGILILSGILYEKRDEVMNFINMSGMTVIKEIHVNEWLSLATRRK